MGWRLLAGSPGHPRSLLAVSSGHPKSLLAMSSGRPKPLLATPPILLEILLVLLEILLAVSWTSSDPRWPTRLGMREATPAVALKPAATRRYGATTAVHASAVVMANELLPHACGPGGAMSS